MYWKMQVAALVACSENKHSKALRCFHPCQIRYVIRNGGILGRISRESVSRDLIHD